jgi:adenylate cyclase
LAARRAPGTREPLRPARDGESIELVYYQADDTVLCDSAYIVKGAPGRILWGMLKAYADYGCRQFSNRELRLDDPRS